jgi:hypothetical protein
MQDDVTTQIANSINNVAAAVRNPPPPPRKIQPNEVVASIVESAMANRIEGSVLAATLQKIPELELKGAMAALVSRVIVAMTPQMATIDLRENSMLVFIDKGRTLSPSDIQKILGGIKVKGLTYLYTVDSDFDLAAVNEETMNANGWYREKGPREFQIKEEQIKAASDAIKYYDDTENGLPDRIVRPLRELIGNYYGTFGHPGVEGLTGEDGVRKEAGTFGDTGFTPATNPPPPEASLEK